MSACRGCGVALVWIKSATTGRPIPCTASSLRTWRPGEDEGAMVVETTGRVVRVATGGPAVWGYAPHHATCPKAELFRQGRETD